VNAVRRFCRLSGFDRRLVLEAAVVLGVIRLALCAMSLRTTRRFLGRLVRASDMWQKGDHQALPEPIVRAVKRAREYIPGATCLVQALAVEMLLERRGCPARVHIGMARTKEQFAAHAWVESQGKTVLGGGTDVPYTPLPAFDGERLYHDGRAT